MDKIVDRRKFMKTAASITTGIVGLSVLPAVGLSMNNAAAEGIHIIGPKEGYSPQIGTLVSMMTWMRHVIVDGVEKLKAKDLDYLHDAGSNTIGAMLLHLAATERGYQVSTFESDMGYKSDGKTDWQAAMGLGDRGRKNIKGNSIDYYLTILNETRLKTLDEFKKRDDTWLMKVDPSFFQGMPTNNYCKWFHVCEHESNHYGQIKWIMSRLPGAKPGND